MLEFVKLVQKALPVSVDGIHVGVETFGSEAEVNVDFNVHFNQESFSGAIDGINYPGGTTSTGNALSVVMTKLLPQSKRRAIQHTLVMLIAGKADDDPISLADEIKGSGARIFCVGVGVMFDRGQLDAMASSPSSTHVMTTKFNELGLQAQALVAAILKGK